MTIRISTGGFISDGHGIIFVSKKPGELSKKEICNLEDLYKCVSFGSDVLLETDGGMLTGVVLNRHIVTISL